MSEKEEPSSEMDDEDQSHKSLVLTCYTKQIEGSIQLPTLGSLYINMKLLFFRQLFLRHLLKQNQIIYINYNAYHGSHDYWPLWLSGYGQLRRSC